MNVKTNTSQERKCSARQRLSGLGSDCEGAKSAGRRGHRRFHHEFSGQTVSGGVSASTGGTTGLNVEGIPYAWAAELYYSRSVCDPIKTPMRKHLTSQLLKAFFNHKLTEYGKMTTLHIDTQAKHISLTANLLGETEPIDASMRYMLEESDGRTFFVPQELDCSRQWLSLLAQQMLKDNVIRFEIPDGIATTVLKMLKI